METISVPKNEFNDLQNELLALKKQIQKLQDNHFIDKLEWAYHFFNSTENSSKLPLKRGAGIGLISKIPANFNDEFLDFEVLN
jgi:hypothetical protein